MPSNNDFRIVSVNHVLKEHPRFNELTSQEYYEYSETSYLGQGKDNKFYFIIHIDEFRERLSEMLKHGRMKVMEFNIKPYRDENFPDEFRRTGE